MGYHTGVRFSRHGSGRSKQDEIGSTIYTSVDELMTNRWKLLAPFDMVADPVDDLFRFALSTEQWGAWRLLKTSLEGFERAINMSNEFVVIKPHSFHIKVKLGARTVPCIGVQWRALPEKLQEDLHNWVIRTVSLEQETELVKNRVKALMRACTTAGQIERVWPDLLGFMPPETVDQRLDKKMKSPIPSTLLDFTEGPDLNPNYGYIRKEFAPEVLECFTDSIAAALVLPRDRDHTLYPEVSLLK